MGLQSLQYCAFLVVVAAVYLHLPVRMQPVFLLGASWVFYALAMPAMLPVTIALAVFTYLCGRGLAWRGGAHKTAFLRLGVIGMLGILAFFKYNGLLGGVLHGWRAVAMPLGISFTSFAAIAYLIDATRGDCEVETSFIRLALFLNFFATVTQGPICRAGALLPQLSAEHRFDAARTVRALRLYALGLFKYIAVADVLNMVVDTVFPHYADYSAPMLILTAVMYTFYLYFSFSGYSEISRATGLVLGLDLPENFKTPFYATNFSGFWSRWHISFSSWLQDYLFMPLAWADLGRFGRLPTELCVFCVFFASGFWHGSTAPFIIWGLLQAVYRVGEELLHRRFGKPKKRGMVPLVGFKSTCVTYERHERMAGESHYPLSKMLALAFDGITSLSIKPIRFITGFGVFVALVSFIGVLWAVIEAALGLTVSGWASMTSIICFVSGVQLICLGVIGEYIGKIYLESKHRPRYIISDATPNFGEIKEDAQ